MKCTDKNTNCKVTMTFDHQNLSSSASSPSERSCQNVRNSPQDTAKIFTRTGQADNLKSYRLLPRLSEASKAHLVTVSFLAS